MASNYRQAEFFGGLAVVLAIFCVVVASIAVSTLIFRPTTGTAQLDQSGSAAPQALPAPQSGYQSSQVNQAADQAPPANSGPGAAGQAPAAKGVNPPRVTPPATPASSEPPGAGSAGLAKPEPAARSGQ